MSSSSPSSDNGIAPTAINSTPTRSGEFDSAYTSPQSDSSGYFMSPNEDSSEIDSAGEVLERKYPQYKHNKNWLLEYEFVRGVRIFGLVACVQHQMNTRFGFVFKSKSTGKLFCYTVCLFCTHDSYLMPSSEPVYDQFNFILKRFGQHLVVNQELSGELIKSVQEQIPLKEITSRHPSIEKIKKFLKKCVAKSVVIKNDDKFFEFLATNPSNKLSTHYNFVGIAAPSDGVWCREHTKYMKLAVIVEDKRYQLSFAIMFCEQCVRTNEVLSKEMLAAVGEAMRTLDDEPISAAFKNGY
ncbi:unnamed protein product [Caenorhabditis bovis]|uniref:Uncharacterized protein n=1 Tax=Caenorhabditis bovis TaxID=2654633 RepID=A0A8S1FEK1_9PELO|nr:unnamed protein product [Caenorhabditis bovis]